MKPKSLVYTDFTHADLRCALLLRGFQAAPAPAFQSATAYENRDPFVFLTSSPYSQVKKTETERRQKVMMLREEFAQSPSAERKTGVEDRQLYCTYSHSEFTASHSE
jgi:hypothetical protein